MISAVSWVPPGVAKATPVQYEVNEEEQLRMKEGAQKLKAERSQAKSAAAAAGATDADIEKIYGLDDYSDDEADSPPPGVFHSAEDMMEMGGMDDSEYEDASDI